MTRRLLWELRYRREEFSIDAGRAKGRPYPDWFLDRPELARGEDSYLRAFWDLATERKSDGLTLGRIPWSAARKYALEELGFYRGLLDHFWRIISAMDTGFLGFMREEHETHVRMNAPKPSKVGGRSTSRRTYSR